MNRPMIQLRGLTKTYGEGAAAIQALRGIDLTIMRGEFVAIMGPPGSGKSTLLHVLGCLASPSSGHYLYQNIAVDRLNADQRAQLRRHALGFVFQGFNLLARTSALENVELPLLYRGFARREREAAARDALDAVGLGDHLRNSPAELCGCQQQRIAIARAMVTRPLTLLADQPTENLDSRSAHEIMSLLARLSSERRLTLLMITHDKSVSAFANRIIHVRDGLIASDAPPPTCPLPVQHDLECIHPCHP